jgi:hypothetical protein
VAGNQQLLIAARLVQVTTIGAPGTTSRSLVPDVATLAWPDMQALGALPRPWTGRTHRILSPHDEGAAALRKAKRLIADYVNHMRERRDAQAGVPTAPNRSGGRSGRPS